MGPPPRGSFAIDARALRREFLALQSQAHPDRHATGVKHRAEAASARINEAYKTLLDPLARALYLLELRGVLVQGGDERVSEEDQDLLMEVLELREQAESARDEEEVEVLKQENEQRVDESVEVLERAFMDDDLQRARSETVRLRYWINVKNSLDAWERGQPVVLQH
ncbi:MAG: hypothetical protein M1838_000468 [Thelocarpon superellum]|nr:MAG: hypothetical protein M1838_000468 [Thelocarpon superellum]